jgi:antitoxin (DNA-binding transcriptional repressor) of toxin-antitoxin stability system
MGVTANDVVSLTRARADLSALAEQANAGAEKIITKHGESYVALIGSARLAYYQQLERERVHLLLLDDAMRALADIAFGSTKAANAAVADRQRDGAT